MKKYLQIKNVLFFTLLLSMMTTWLVAEKRGMKNLPGPLYKADTGQFDGNRIRDDLENNGMLVSHRITGHSGMEWPKDANLYINFASGVWIAGKVNGDIRTAVAEYGPEFVAGPWGSDAGASDHQLYIVNKSDLADPLASDDFQNWPADLGAPWVDVDGDGSYDPLPTGNDYPEFIGDQVIWFVMNDGEQSQHSIFSTLPIGLEVQMTVWGYDRPDAFGDMMFVKSLIINKGGVDIDSTVIGLWSDPDLGDAGDDFVGCDTTLSLGFCYNDGADHDYGGDPPAIGYDFFQGPIVASAGDTAFAYGRSIPGFKNLEMSSFTKYINEDDPVWSDPNSAVEMYNLMNGLMKSGDPFINTETGEATKFVLADDPNLNTGAGDGVWVDSDDHASGDRRFLMNAGPFTLADGDSQEVVFGMLIARGSDALTSITALKQADALAQLAYDIQFALPPSPTSPNVAVSTAQDAIILNWDDGVNSVESYTALDVIDKLPVPVLFDTTWTTDITFGVTSDTSIVGTDTTITFDTTYTFIQVVDFIDTTFEGENTLFTFQGYNVYQLETASGQGAVKRVATYDLIDGIEEIFDNVFDPVLGETINRRVQFGSDSGIKRSIEIDTDGLNAGIPLKTNRAYYYAVTAYGYNPYGIPRTLESSKQIMTIRPQIATTSEDAVTSYGTSSIAAEHSVGVSDGSVVGIVIDPLLVTGDDYQISFHFNDDSSAIVWDVDNTTDGTTLVLGNAIQTGTDMETGNNVGLDANPIVEGLQIQVTGAPDDLKWVGVTANASGELASPVDALAYWYFPKYLIADGDYTDQQTTTEATWFFNVGPQYGVDQDALLGAVFPYTGGYAVPGSGIGYIIPDDFEVRFTGAGKAINYWVDESVVDVPFEWWNIGVASDPSDDYQLIPYFLDEDGNGEWNLQFGSEDADHGTSGAFNDPWTDRVYVLSPTDNTPGTQGYDNFMAAAPDNYGGLPAWYSGAGWTDPGGPLDAWNTFSRTTFMIWNGGDVTTATSPADYSAESPEIGTIFRIATTKPNTVNDVFTLKTSDYKTGEAAFDPKSINVWPNPYFANNPEERSPLERIVTFTHLPEEGTATIRVFNLAGELVRKIVHDNETQYEVWDLANNFNIPVASGMYIAHIETSAGNKILKIAVIQPEERIDVY
ncbi:MAG: T9SS type A sorting domain-containing protein [Candidatus Marinimicrobia bacterium]|nr:T9SS type A sorting domain-containing protein [Candidatus Neomarinimicrobiota bacterium]